MFILFSILFHISVTINIIKRRFFLDLFNILVYNSLQVRTGGILMNEFEKNPQYQGSDVVDSIIGFTVSFIFFFVIFGIGFIISVVN